MTILEMQPVDYRQLMKKVESFVDRLDDVGDIGDTVQTGASAIVSEFRDELGISGGRLYRRQDDRYILQNTFGEAKPVSTGVEVPRDYPPIEEVLKSGVLFMRRDDPGIDHHLEDMLGVDEFATIAVGNDDYVLAFDVDGSRRRDDILFSLGILRHALEARLRRERIEDVFKQARQIQQSILPRDNPDFPPYDLAGKSESMESVGGDFYDFIPLTDKVLGLTIADVSGHGLPAALQVRDIFMGMRMGLERDFKIVRTVERLNRIIHQSTLTSRFVSMFYGELEQSGLFIYVNAGHPAPFHLRADGRVTYLSSGGPVLGPLPDATYARGFVTLGPGDLIVLFTDGISETLRSHSASDLEEYGVDRLLAVVEENRKRTSQEIIDAVFADLDAFRDPAVPVQDDRSLVILRVPEDAEPG